MLPNGVANNVATARWGSARESLGPLFGIAAAWAGTPDGGARGSVAGPGPGSSGAADLGQWGLEPILTDFSIAAVAAVGLLAARVLLNRLVTHVRQGPGVQALRSDLPARLIRFFSSPPPFSPAPPPGLDATFFRTSFALMHSASAASSSCRGSCSALPRCHASRSCDCGASRTRAGSCSSTGRWSSGGLRFSGGSRGCGPPAISSVGYRDSPSGARRSSSLRVCADRTSCFPQRSAWSP